MSLNATSAVILGLLHDGPATGGDIVVAAGRRLGAQGGVTRSQVFRELPLLLADGLIRADADTTVAGHRASHYLVTRAGRAAFTEWAAAPSGPDTVRSGTVMRLGFGAHLRAAQRTAIVRAAVIAHELALSVHEQLAKDLRGEGDAYAAVAADFAVAYERAFLGWLRAAPELGAT
ncbi:MAG: PadR family transcriptional regulator [Actinomycetota bacterium]|nr:PadR family transcriptional regulator [Actinomycetota bacterium]